MIKWAHLAVQTRTRQDFALLTKFLAALGLEGHVDQDTGTHVFISSSAVFRLIPQKNEHQPDDLNLTVSDPDSAFEVVREMSLDVIDDSSGPEPTHTLRLFRVRFPGGTTVRIIGSRVSQDAYLGKRGQLVAKGKRFAIVTARFNSFIVERLLAGAIDGLDLCGIDRDRYKSIEIVRVPGAFEIPSAARTLAETGKYDAIICLGCLLRGDTAHYDVIVNEVTRGIGQSAQETGVPHAFGVLTCDTLEQAIDRAGLKMGNKGFEAALAAIEMANLKKAVVGSRSSVVGKSKNKTVARRTSGVARKSKKNNPGKNRT